MTDRRLFDAGVKPYRETGYYEPDYVPSDTDVLAAFRLTPQPGVTPEEAGAAVAGESSTATWTTVWSDHMVDLDRYKAKCYRLDPVPGRADQFIAYIAYDLDLFEEGSIANLASSIVGNVFGFKALKALRLEDLRFPEAYIKTFPGPPNGIQVERDRLGKYGRPILGATIKPKLGLSPKMYARAVYECLRGGLDFTKDDENINSQPFMRWRHRFEFVAEAIRKAEEETGERKGHYLNVTAPDVEQMLERAEFAKECSPIIMVDFLTVGFSAFQTLSHWCRRNGVLLHLHRAMHAVSTRQRDHGIHWRVYAQWARLIGGDHVHNGTVVGKLEGDRNATVAVNDLLREDFVPADVSRGIYFDQPWASLPPMLPVASGGIHAAQVPELISIFGDDVVLQFGGGTLGHPRGNAAGATANRVAIDAAVKARNEGRDLLREGRAILEEAARTSPELAEALDLWGGVTFEEADPTNVLDPVEVTR